MSILLRIAYDGTEFSGWARQKPRRDGTPIRTVQGELESALSGLYREPVELRGASRTDAGVHALGQLAAFEPPGTIPPRGVMQALAGRLPRDVTVVAAWEQQDHANVRGGNGGKRYRYRIRTSRARDPIGGRDEWHLGRRLDLARMRAAAAAFVGTHDYAAFRTAQCQARTSTRTVTRVHVTGVAGPLGPPEDAGRFDAGSEDQALVTVDVEGHAFLHNMVRIMAGTLVEVGLGRREPDVIEALLRRGERQEAGPTAPACGLTLLEVRWPRPSVSV